MLYETDFSFLIKPQKKKARRTPIVITLRRTHDNDKQFRKKFFHRFRFSLPDLPFVTYALLPAKASKRYKRYILPFWEELKELNELFICTKDVYEKLGGKEWIGRANAVYMHLLNFTHEVIAAPFTHLLYKTNFFENLSSEDFVEINSYIEKYPSEIMYFHFLRREFGLTLSEICWGIFLSHFLTSSNLLSIIFRESMFRRWNFVNACFGNPKNLHKTYKVSQRYVETVVNRRFPNGILFNHKKVAFPFFAFFHRSQDERKINFLYNYGNIKAKGIL